MLWQEHTVCEPSTMDTHHHVDGVNQPRKPGDIGAHIGLVNHHLKAKLLCHGNDLIQVEKHSCTVPLDDEQPWLDLGVLTEHGHTVPAQRVSSTHESVEISHRIVVRCLG
ncbi:Os03g0568000 [Oryza sativa Japonica Group]|uniref:Os03g0568000 protein n=1 Tax=Oryza sativa subsp. japonica TaxID=39947 RepID=A0A0P0VZI2_ORYSJ|nr:hypothetical protein EE612_018487 [Oryza sativa]BAS84965.1 Os03g0568000 [Oryza sativa Japonica Group]